MRGNPLFCTVLYGKEKLMKKNPILWLLLLSLLLAAPWPGRVASAAETRLLPETLGEGIRVDNDTKEIYFVPQGMRPADLEKLLREAAPELRITLSAQAENSAFLVTGVTVTVADPQTKESGEYTVRVLGDRNGTGKTAAADARQALRLAVGLDAALFGKYFRALDVNGDSRITASDARLLLRAAVGLENFGKTLAYAGITYYPEAQIRLRHPELAAQINSAALTPKTAVEVKHTREKAEMTWNISIPAEDQALIKQMFASLPQGATNLEKIYAAYRYIQSSFTYARGAALYETIWDKTPLQAVLKMHLAQCLQYNGAIAEVLAFMGYDVKIVEGMLGSGNPAADTVTAFWSHYWTELYLNGKTYLVEVGQPADGWNGDFLVFYSETDGYLYYNQAKKAYSFLQ